MKLLTKCAAILDRVIDSFGILTGILIIYLVLSLSIHVFSRYLLHRPIAGVVELCEVTLMGIAFIGAAWVLKVEGHVKIDMLLNYLNPRHQALLNAITSAAGVVICFLLAWYGAKVSLDQFQRGSMTMGETAFPKGPLLTVITVGTFLLFIQFIRRTHGYLKNWRGLLSKG